MQAWTDMCECLYVPVGMARDLVETQLGNDAPHARFSGIVLPLLLRHAKSGMETQELPDSGGPWQLWLLLCIPAKPSGMLHQDGRVIRQGSTTL